MLITGANGQLGQDFQKLFEKEGINFIATDITPNYDSVDITNLDELRDFARRNPIEIIINCAAYNAVDKAEDEWKSAYLINGIGPRNLALVANEINATLIHYSTDFVFNGQKGSPYTILDTPSPISKYGESKLLGEKFVQQHANRYYLIRVSWLFGKGNENFVTKVLRWSKGKNELKIVIDEVSSPTYTIDLANATYRLLKTEAYGLYHITNSGKCSRYEWSKYILDEVGWEGNLLETTCKDFDLPAKRPEFSVLDNFGTKEIIGYELPNWKDATSRFLRELG
ncbi:MAG: dTDP-4-dehydrorhamnose reductase [Candidatus Hodarchaeota archaeon]